MAFTKRRPDAPPGFFAAEAAGLAWLAAAGPQSVPVVEVLDVGVDHVTVTELEPVAPSPEAATDFGRRLARTHAAGAPAFGSGPPDHPGTGYIGDLELPLRTEPSWGSFFAAHRIRPYLRQARDHGLLDDSHGAVIERVCARLEAGEFDDGRAPERIHGDLWAGNVIFTAGGVTLIDPAAHGGCGLTDLAMLALFGTPHLDLIQASYAEAAELAPGWRELIGLHQLHPLLVHCVLFPGSYAEQTMAVARHYA